MITISVKPRQDNRFDAYVGDEGDHFLNSDQGYENVEDIVAIVRRLWPPLVTHETKRIVLDNGFDFEIDPEAVEKVVAALALEPVVLEITYRDGTVRSERLR